METENNNILKVNIGSYFSAPIVVIGSMLITAALGIFFLWALGFITSSATVTELLKDLLVKYLAIIILLTIAGCILIFTERILLFNPEKKEIMRGWRLWEWTRGEWEAFQPNCSHFAFQRYEQTHHFSYGGLYERKISEYIYDLRLIFPDQTFQSLVSASEFNAVTQIILLGRKLSEVYNLPFNDYVLEILKKQRLG